jgi:DnaJ-class molecular chaperone
MKTKTTITKVTEINRPSRLEEAIEATTSKPVPETPVPETAVPKGKPREVTCTCKHAKGAHRMSHPVGCQTCNCIGFRTGNAAWMKGAAALSA